MLFHCLLIEFCKKHVWKRKNGKKESTEQAVKRRKAPNGMRNKGGQGGVVMCLCRTIWSRAGSAKFAFLFAPFYCEQLPYSIGYYYGNIFGKSRKWILIIVKADYDGNHHYFVWNIKMWNHLKEECMQICKIWLLQEQQHRELGKLIFYMQKYQWKEKKSPF